MNVSAWVRLVVLVGGEVARKVGSRVTVVRWHQPGSVACAVADTVAVFRWLVRKPNCD